MPEYYLDMERYFYDGGCVDGDTGQIKILDELGDEFKITINGNAMNKSEVDPYRGRIRIPCTFEDPEANIETLQGRIKEQEALVAQLTTSKDATIQKLKDLQASYQQILDEGGILKPKEEDALYGGDGFVNSHETVVEANNKLNQATATLKEYQATLKDFDDRLTTSMIGLNDQGAAYLFNFSFTLTTYPYDDWQFKQETPIPRYKHRGVPIRPGTWDTEEQRAFPMTKKLIDELDCRGDGTFANPLYDVSSCVDRKAQTSWLDCDIEYDVTICFEDLCNLCSHLNFALISLLLEFLRQG
jgi:hypothetical protein